MDFVPPFSIFLKLCFDIFPSMSGLDEACCLWFEAFDTEIEKGVSKYLTD